MKFAFQRPRRPMQRQEYPEVFYINGAIHLVRTEAVSKDIFGTKVSGYIMAQEDSFDIDDPLDLRIAEGLLYADHQRSDRIGHLDLADASAKESRALA